MTVEQFTRDFTYNTIFEEHDLWCWSESWYQTELVTLCYMWPHFLVWCCGAVVWPATANSSVVVVVGVTRPHWSLEQTLSNTRSAAEHATVRWHDPCWYTIFNFHIHFKKIVTSISYFKELWMNCKLYKKKLLSRKILWNRYCNITVSWRVNYLISALITVHLTATTRLRRD